MNASLNEKLGNVKWGKYKLGELFKIQNTSSFNADVLVDGSEYDYITRTSLNQGVLQTTGFVNHENINPAGTWSLGLLQMDFFYRNKPWYAGQFVKIIIPKFSIPEGAIHYFTTVLNRQKTLLLSVLVRNVDKVFKDTTVLLPLSADGSIDFCFMESFISELEAERMTRLNTFLTVNDLKNCNLSQAEEDALVSLESYEWEDVRIGSLFKKINTKKLPYKADDLPTSIQRDYTLPCLTSSFRNQGLNYYAPREGATILKNVISIPSNSDVYRAYYQSREFTVLSDAYAIRWIYGDRSLLPLQYLFMVTCINKRTDLSIYSYKNKLGGWNVVKNKFIKIPIKDGKPDYEFMKAIISAIQKLLIKDVVAYANRKSQQNRKGVTDETVERWS